jgi:hypothetical protein
MREAMVRDQFELKPIWSRMFASAQPLHPEAIYSGIFAMCAEWAWKRRWSEARLQRDACHVCGISIKDLCLQFIRLRARGLAWRRFLQQPPDKRKPRRAIRHLKSRPRFLPLRSGSAPSSCLEGLAISGNFPFLLDGRYSLHMRSPYDEHEVNYLMERF